VVTDGTLYKNALKTALIFLDGCPAEKVLNNADWFPEIK